MSRARENAPDAEGASHRVKNQGSGPDPLEVVIVPTSADRLGWALAEQGIDPALFDLADDDAQPATVVVRTPLRTATRGLISVSWDESEGRAVGVCAGTSGELLEAAAVLKALTATGPGDLPLAPPEDPLDPWSVIVATAHRLGLAVQSRPMNSGSRSMSVLFALRDWLESDAAAGVELKTSDTAVLMLLALHMDRNGQGAFPGVDRIARGVRLSPRTVETCLHRLRRASLIVPLVEHPRLGEAQTWRMSDAFRAVLTNGSGATLQRAPHTAGAYAETADEQRASAYPKQKESKSSSSGLEIDEHFHELADADVARREATGELVVTKNRSGLVAKVAREDRPRLHAEEEDRKAQAARDKAHEDCDRCDQDGWLWLEPDGTPTTRGAGAGYKCDHTDVLEWATTNVIAAFPGAEVIEDATG
jgi:hypothetical protein